MQDGPDMRARPQMSMPWPGRRIVVTGDFLRPYWNGQEWESASWKNIRWLQQQLSPALAAGQPLCSLAWDPHYPPAGQQQLDTPALYARMGCDLTHAGWARLSVARTPPPALLQALAPLEGALVIGYEMPPVLLAALDALGVPWVDVVLHPWRFLPDLVFGLRSSVPAFQAFFASQRLPAGLVAQRVAHIRAKAAWMSRPSPRLRPGSALLLGQVGLDRAAVLPDGRIASLQDHLARLHVLCTEHSDVLFRPHPYEPAQEGVHPLCHCLPTLKPTTLHPYLLFAQPELVKVLALNSSGLVEAAAFGLETENLIPFLYRFDAQHRSADAADLPPVPQGGGWLTPVFWQALFGDGQAQAQLQACPQVFAEVNRLRASMNADWGWGEMDKVVA